MQKNKQNEDGNRKPVENIERNVGARMADVAEVVRSDAANIHSDFALNDGPKYLLLLGHAVVQLKFRLLLRHLVCNYREIQLLVDRSR